MRSRRLAKAAEAVRESVSTTILFEIKDPRVQNVTVLHAEVAPDMRSAKVYVSVMGDAKKQSLCMHGLESARGFIQAKVADRMQTRYTPILTFVLDQGVKKSLEASRMIRDVLPGAGESAAAGELAAEDVEPDDADLGDEEDEDALDRAEGQGGEDAAAADGDDETPAKPR